MAHHSDASTFAEVLEHIGDDGKKELLWGPLEQALHDLIGAT